MKGECFLRHFNSHEDAESEERNNHASTSDEQEQDAIELAHAFLLVGHVQQNEADRAHREHETRRQAFHNVLTVYTPLHKCNLSSRKQLNLGGKIGFNLG